MSETEQLKKQAEEQHAEQIAQRFSSYINGLFALAESARVNWEKSQLYSGAALLTLMVSLCAMVFFPSLWATINTEVARVLFWLTLIYEWVFVLPRMTGAVHELRGALKILELLGWLNTDSGPRRKLKEFEEIKIIKVWDWLKKKAREHAYQPA